MPAIFPALRPDEPLYSAIARHADAMLLSDTYRIARAVFNLERINAVIDIPPRLDAFHAALPIGYDVSLDELIDGHTAFLYYSSFISGERARRAREAMRLGDARTAISRLGIARERATTSLLFCQECVLADKESFDGMPYWRRVHQLPGMFFCPDHEISLSESGIPRQNAHSLLSFISLDLALRRESVFPIVEFDRARQDDLLAFAIDSAWLLRGRLAHQNVDLQRQFRLWLRGAGWAHNHRGFKNQALIDRVHEVWGSDVLSELRLVGENKRIGGRPSSGSSTDNVTAIFRSRRNLSTRPVPYLILLSSIRISAENICTRSPPEIEPKVARLTEPCGNPACPAHDPPVPRPLDVAPSIAWVIVECPTCEFTYGQSPDQTNPTHRKIIEYGPVWDNRLKELIAEGMATQPVFRAELGLTVSWIKRRALELGVWHPRWGDQTRRRTESIAERAWIRKIPERTDHYRSQWLQLRQTYPDLSMTELSRFDQVTYYYLHRNDKEWLLANSPKRVRRLPSRNFIDWEYRDRATVLLIIEAVRTILSRAGRPKRLTRASISSNFGSCNVLRQQLRHLPRSRALLDRLVDTDNSILLRRLHFGAALYVQDQIVPTPAQLAKRSGLDPRVRRANQGTVVSAVNIIRHHVRSGEPLPARCNLQLKPEMLSKSNDGANA